MLGLTALGPLMFYVNFLSWAGDYCRGPRYLTYLIPLRLIPAVVSGWSTLRSRLAKAAVVAVVVAGLGVQLLGSAIYWDHWIRISMHARFEWLGQPNRDGAAITTNSLGLCDACFEDMAGHQWLPPLSPIAGHCVARDAP